MKNVAQYAFCFSVISVLSNCIPNKNITQNANSNIASIDFKAPSGIDAKEYDMVVLKYKEENSTSTYVEIQLNSANADKLKTIELTPGNYEFNMEISKNNKVVAKSNSDNSKCPSIKQNLVPGSNSVIVKMCKENGGVISVDSTSTTIGIDPRILDDNNKTPTSSGIVTLITPAISPTSITSNPSGGITPTSGPGIITPNRTPIIYATSSITPVNIQPTVTANATNNIGYSTSGKTIINICEDAKTNSFALTIINKLMDGTGSYYSSNISCDKLNYTYQNATSFAADWSGVSIKLESLSVFAGMNNLTSLELLNAGVKNIEGIKNLPNLNVVNLSGNEITNIDVIATLPKIDTLKLSNNKITSVVILLKSTGISYLNLGGNNISDLDSLKNHPNYSRFSKWILY